MEGEVFSLIESALGAKEVDVPECKVIVGKEDLHFGVVFLNGLVLLLESFAHPQGHLLDILLLIYIRHGTKALT